MNQIQAELADQRDEVRQMAPDADRPAADRDHAGQRRYRCDRRPRLMIRNLDALEHPPMFRLDLQLQRQSASPGTPQEHGAGTVDRFEVQAIPAAVGSRRPAEHVGQFGGTQ